MYKLRVILIIGIVFCFASSCTKDILDRPTESEIEDNEFFNSADDLEIAVNDLYSVLPNFTLYTDDSSTDLEIGSSIASRIRGTRKAPTGKGGGGWAWSNLRKINFVLENYKTVDDEEAKAHYSGVAKFFRAYFYFDKVKKFGDVPWYNKVIEVVDEDELKKPRDSRELVMDSILSDLDYAIDHIDESQDAFKITRYTALLLKSRVALYEGTYRKYHGLTEDYNDFLRESVTASEKLIMESPYELFQEEGPNEAYRRLFERNNQDNMETILARKYNDSDKHNLGHLYTSATNGGHGYTKKLINSYLMKDGTRFTDKSNYETLGFYEEMQDRDPRLTQTTAGPNYIPMGETNVEAVDLEAPATGYRVIKALGPKTEWGTEASTTDVIIFRYAEALLNFAEAKAELGELNQNDIDNSINQLRERVGMPTLEMAEANANPDPYLEDEYLNVTQNSNTGVILEIRRERQIEMISEGLRWDDLMRWKEGKKIEEPLLGIYFNGAGGYDFNGDGESNVYLYEGDDSVVPDNIPSRSIRNILEIDLYDPITGSSDPKKGNIDFYPNRGTFDESRDYLLPLPLQDLRLNDNLEQNPGWEDVK